MNEIFTRTSIRQFEGKEVEQEKIEELLEAAMQAPSAGNQQPWLFYVIKNRETLEQLSKSSPYAGCVKNAPLAIVIAYKDDATYPELCEIDCAIATENIYLEAEVLGLGTVMLAVAPYEDRMEAVSNTLDLPDDIHPFTILPIGYPKNKGQSKSRYDENKVTFVD